MRRLITVIAGLMCAAATVPVVAGPANAATLNVCAWQIPPGYTKVNDNWSPTSCGNPPQYQLNVWTVESYTDKPVGAVMNVCSGWRPPGWVTIRQSWSPNTCGHPSTIVNNVWTIQRAA